MSLGERIKNARLDKGLSQKEFAELIGEKNNTLCNWEKDISRPNADALTKICSALGVSADYLLAVENDESFRYILNDEAMEFVRSVFARKELKTLFSLCKNATKEDVENAIKIIKMFKDKSKEC